LPSYFTGLTPATVEMTPGDWNSENTSQAAQRNALYNYVVELTGTYSTIYPDVPLLISSDGRIALSNYGESYMLAAVPGIYVMCPELFFSQVYIPTIMPMPTYNPSTENEGSFLDGTDLMRGLDRIGAYIHMSGSLLLGIIVIIAAIIAMAVCIVKDWGIESGGIVAGIILLCAAAIARNVLFTLVMVLSLGIILLLAWIIYQRRTT
jgi:hypothetical protein